MLPTNEFIIYTGCMFAGKTTALIYEYEKAVEAGKSVVCLKPALDTRYANDAIVTHDGKRVEAIPVATLSDVKGLRADVIIIDELQFYPIGITSRVKNWLRTGATVVVAGLDLDARGLPFENMERLLPYATDVFKLKADCAYCGDVATRSIKTAGDNSRIDLGNDDKYKAVCLNCFHEKEREELEAWSKKSSIQDIR